jgi:hypothetical protein
MKRLITLFIAFFLAYHVGAQSSYRNEWIDYSKTYHKFKLHFGVDNIGFPIKKGLVRVYQPALSAAGLSSTPAEHLQLWKDGTEVAIYTSIASGIFTATDYIEFWGEINNGVLDNDLYRDTEFQLSDIWSVQTDTAAYFLTVNSASTNKRLETAANNVLGNALPATEYFMSSVSFTHRFEINPGFAAQAAQPLYSSSYDRGEGYTSRPIRPIGNSCGQETLPLTFSGLKPYLSGPSMIMKINAVGSAPNARTVLVRLNGDTVSNFQMDYTYDAKIEEYGISTSKISGGSAFFEFINESQVDCDEFRLAKTELTYPRTLDGNAAKSMELKLPASGSGHYLRFYNFNAGSNPPILYDLTNNKRYVGDLSIADTIQFVTDPFFTTSSFVLVQDDISNTKDITDFQQRSFVDYTNVANQGDYLIISNPLIYGTGGSNYVEQYKQYRSSLNGGGYNAKIIDIHEITDQFAYGVSKHPLSIRNFLRYARANFSAAPKFVFLIGKAVNYKEYRENGWQPDIDLLNLVPTWGHPASDNLLSADNNLDATPITPIGRLNAVTANEVGDYLLKVKQYDSVQRSSSNTIADKAWMKNVLQVAGANDLSIGLQLDAYLARYKTIIEDSIFGGKAKNYDKIDDPSSYSASIRDFRSTYESGASLVTYFGHSSASNLDFSLDNPSAYNNQYKYPLFIVNGCDAGNFFTYDQQRFNFKSTISEKFIFEPQRGAIGYMATTGYGVVNYLDSFTRKFYRAIARTQYNQPFGEIVKQGIMDVLATTGSSDYFARLHSEQFTFHGDPAIKVNGFSKPDYAVEAQQITISPSFISVSADSFYVKVRVYNIGRKSNDSVSFRLQRQYPGGNTETVYTKKFLPITALDSVMVALPIVANRDKGTTNITATADYDNAADEIAEDNNSASVAVTISEAEIRPVYPYKYAIVSNPVFKLAASTANALDTSKIYVVEMDTTALFNSPIKYTQTKIAVGGVVEFDNGMAMQDSGTYFWRVAVQDTNQYWNVSSFTYRNIANVGFEQKHFYQHTDSKLSRLNLDSSTRAYTYPNMINNLFVLHSIYPTSGTEDQQFSIQVNGSGIIASACLGQSVIINVFDTLTFKPWENTTNPFGAEPTCDNSRKYNFEYHYIDYGGREGARQFLESIPNGMYVAVRLVYDGDAVWANEWKDDELTNGAGISLYHSLKDQGLPIDSFDKARTFGFVFKKNDSTRFAPHYQFTQGLYDRVVMNVDCNTKDTLGYVTSPKFGPAKTWKNVKWHGTSNPNNLATVDVLGINNAGAETRLYTLTTAEQNVDISAVSAVAYPNIKLKLRNQDSLTAIPYQLSQWSVEYDAVPEGAIAPNLFVSIPDTVGTSFGDTLQIAVAFKNVSKVNFDSLKVRIVLYNEQGISDTINLPKVKPLNAGDTVNIHASIDVAQRYEGRYNFYLMVNPDNDQLEQYSFNNSLFKYVYFKTGFVDANHYYSMATGELHSSNSWGVNPDGTGGKPLNFAGTNKTFELANRSGSYSLNSSLSIDGSVIIPALSALNISSNNLSIGKDMTVNGSIIGNGKTILNGTSAQNISGTGSIRNLELNNTAGATIAAGPSNQLTIVGSYIPTNGLFNTNDNLILFSDANNTARIATGNIAGNYITGKVQMQRFIPGGFRKYRFVGHPFAAAMGISELTDDMDITGAITGSNANNFTATTTSNPSAFTFNETMDDGVMQGNGNNSGWEAITSGNFATEISNGQGIRILVRGSKGQAGSLTGGAYTPAAVTLKMNGVPKQGDFNLSLAYTDVNRGWNFIANPYASNLDWESVEKVAADNACYTFRPTFNGGVYASYVNGSSTNGASNIIESSSGFFVRANGNGPNLTFHETAKVGDMPLNSMFRHYTNINNRLMLQLKQDSLNITDDVVLRFGDDNATDGFDKKFDAYNLANNITDLYVLDATNTKYSIYHGSNLEPANLEKREVALGITTNSKGSHSITAITLDAFLNGNKAFLKDKELDILTEITDSINYSFTVSNSASVKDRFSIVFNAKNIQIVPVQPNFSIKASPNPAKDILNINFTGTDESAATTIRFVSSNGAIMKTINAGNVQSGNYKVDIKNWANGIYIVELTNGKEKQALSVSKQGN